MAYSANRRSACAIHPETICCSGGEGWDRAMDGRVSEEKRDIDIEIDRGDVMTISTK